MPPGLLLMDIAAFLSPERARCLAPQSAERALASLALRALWHQLFDRAPAVVGLAPPDGKAIMEPFLQWAAAKNLSMGWAMHLHLLGWLLGEPTWRPRLTDSDIEQLAIAAVQRWAVATAEDFRSCAIVVCCPQLVSHGIGARRPDTAAAIVRIFRLQIDPTVRPRVCAFATASDARQWNIGPWQPLPK